MHCSYEFVPYYKYKVIKDNSFGVFPHYRLDINGRKNFKKWMVFVGFNNPKHLTKIKIWERLGYCPPNTTYSERLKILNGGSHLPPIIPAPGLEFPRTYLVLPGTSRVQLIIFHS